MNFSVSISCDHHFPQAVRRIAFAWSWWSCLLWPVDCWFIPFNACANLLAGRGTSCRTCKPRASLTSYMGDTPGEYAGHAGTGMFKLPVKVCRSLPREAVRWHAASQVDGGGWTAWPSASGSYYCLLASNFHQQNVPVFVVVAYIRPYDNRGASQTVAHTTPYMLCAICPV